MQLLQESPESSGLVCVSVTVQATLHVHWDPNAACARPSNKEPKTALRNPGPPKLLHPTGTRTGPFHHPSLHRIDRGTTAVIGRPLVSRPSHASAQESHDKKCAVALGGQVPDDPWPQKPHQKFRWLRLPLLPGQFPSPLPLLLDLLHRQPPESQFSTPLLRRPLLKVFRKLPVIQTAAAAIPSGSAHHSRFPRTSADSSHPVSTFPKHPPCRSLGRPSVDNECNPWEASRGGRETSVAARSL